ncbi:MAG: S8 family serine peptidase [Clostridiales bacterium]|nr:S8 family serine peptidase [Clostridiales bacterium]
MKQFDKRMIALLAAGACAVGVMNMAGMSAGADTIAGIYTADETDTSFSRDVEIDRTRYTFSAHVFGPGVDNLSLKDPYAQYQWGLRNDGEFQYYEVTNRFDDINQQLARDIDTANMLGLPAPIEGPDAYRLRTTIAVPGIDINISPAWDLYDASTEEHRQVIVAIIDTGIDVSHPELAGALWVNEDEIPDDGIDNDGNGYVDDVNGWNFFDNSNQIYTGTEDKHGTHTAGTISAVRGSLGIAGITDQNYVKFMTIKVLGTEEGVGEDEDVVNAIRYAEANGASICNLSFGTEWHYDDLEQVMRESNMLFVVAAGNGDELGYGQNTDENPDYPSSFHLPNIISVASLMFDGDLAESSNYGVNSIDIAAPGVLVVSTITENGYGFMSGTSMAAPMVTGVAAMLYSYRTDLALSDIKTVIMNSAHKLDTLTDKVACGGMLDAYAALTYGR